MKKIIAIMLAALMLLSLAACGKTTSQNQDSSADTVSGDQTASTADNEAGSKHCRENCSCVCNRRSWRQNL